MNRRDAVCDLMVEYGALIDEDRLEDWVDLFVEDCRYSVITAENLAEGLPQTLIDCASKDMLRDRVTSYRDVNEYNFHTDRHVIGGVRFRDAGDGLSMWKIEASYSLFQTDVEGVTRLFLVGRYECGVVFPEGVPRFCDVRVVVDTAAIPTLLATPV